MFIAAIIVAAFASFFISYNVADTFIRKNIDKKVYYGHIKEKIKAVIDEQNSKEEKK